MTHTTAGLCDVVSVSPSSGVLPPQVGTAGPSQQHVLLSFSPLYVAPLPQWHTYIYNTQ